MSDIMQTLYECVLHFKKNNMGDSPEVVMVNIERREDLFKYYSEKNISHYGKFMVLGVPIDFHYREKLEVYMIPNKNIYRVSYGN